jgi:phospholipid-translocating ATPase
VERDSNSIKIRVDQNNIEQYEILRVVEFDSNRKRMSVVVKRFSDGKIINFIKGADIAIISRLKD